MLEWNSSLIPDSDIILVSLSVLETPDKVDQIWSVETGHSFTILEDVSTSKGVRTSNKRDTRGDTPVVKRGAFRPVSRYWSVIWSVIRSEWTLSSLPLKLSLEYRPTN